MLAAATSGFALAAFAYMRIYPLALLLMVLVGGGTILAAASANTILQTIVDDRLRGRVASFYTLAFLGRGAARQPCRRGDSRAGRRAVHVRAERRAGDAGGAVVSRRLPMMRDASAADLRRARRAAAPALRQRSAKHE